MKKLNFVLLFLIFCLGLLNVSFAQFHVGQKIKFKIFKKPKKTACRAQIRMEANLNKHDNDVDWNFDDNECKILAIPPKAKANTVVVNCKIQARVIFIFGDGRTYYHTTKNPCIFEDIKPKNIKAAK